MFVNEFVHFVRDTAQIDVSIKSEYVTGIQAGVRVYNGIGVFNIINVSFSIVNPDIPRSYCLFPSAAKNPDEKCTTGSHTLFLTMASTPNLGLFLQMASFFRITDDFTYYAYNKPQYSTRFMELSRFYWNITKEKRVFFPFRPVRALLRNYYKEYLPGNEDSKTPPTYQFLGDDAYFIRQTDDFWIFSTTLTVIVFIFFRHLRRFILRFEWMPLWIARLLRKFKWFGFLAVGIAGENVQYLSFRCFSQLFQTETGHRNVLNLLLAFTVLFLVTFYAAGSLLFLPALLRRHSALLIEGFSRSIRTAHYLTLVLLVRLAMGAVHSLLYETSRLQIAVLLGLQALLLGLALFYRRVFLRKSLLAIYIMECVLRIMVHAFLCLNVWLDILVNISSVTDALAGSLLVVSVMDMVFDNTIPYRM